MGRYSQPRITQLLAECDAAVVADVKGDKLELLGRYLLEKIRGISFYAKNVIDAPRAHELDLVFTKDGNTVNLHFLDPAIFVECKANQDRVSSQEVGWFVRKLQDRGASIGILIALSGITGVADGQSNGHSEVLTALVRDKIRILVVTRDEILQMRTSEDLVNLLLEKYLQLTVYRTVR